MANANPWVEKTYDDRVKELQQTSSKQNFKATIVIIGVFAGALSFLAAYAIRDTIKDGIGILSDKIKDWLGIEEKNRASKFLMVFVVFLLTLGIAVGGIWALDNARNSVENQQALQELKEKFDAYCDQTFITLQTQADVNVKRDIFNNNKQCYNKDKMELHLACASNLENIKELTIEERRQYLNEKRANTGFQYTTCYNRSDYEKLFPQR